MGNRTGGIYGRPIKFVMSDDQANPQVSLQLASQIIAKKVPFFLGPSAVAACSAVLPLLKDGPVMYCFSPGIYTDRGSYAFSSSIATRDMLAVSVKYYHARGWNKVALISPTDATGQDGEKSIDLALATPGGTGMTVVAREHFNLTDISVAAQMARIKASGAQAIFAWVSGTAFGTVMRGVTDAGIDLPIVTSTANLTYPQLEAEAAVMNDNVLFPATPGDTPDVLPAGQLRTVVTEYLNAMHAAGIRPDQGHTLAWDPAFLIIGALRKVGTNITATQLRDYLADTRGVVGINGRYDFPAVPQRGLGPSSIIMVRWNKAKDTWVSVSNPGGQPLK